MMFRQYLSKNVWLRRKMDNSFRLRNGVQTPSLQTSTGTRLILLVDEKMGAAAGDEEVEEVEEDEEDEEDEQLLVFGRLGGGGLKGRDVGACLKWFK